MFVNERDKIVHFVFAQVWLPVVEPELGVLNPCSAGKTPTWDRSEEV